MSRRPDGITLVELMVTLMVAAVLLAIGVPIRGEATRRNVPVAIVPVAGDWSKGWTVGVDANGDGTIDGDVVRSEGAAPDGVAVTAGAATAIIFRATGLASRAESFRICDSRTGETGREVGLLATGRTEVKPYACP